jgi:hypothetical protein
MSFLFSPINIFSLFLIYFCLILKVARAGMLPEVGDSGGRGGGRGAVPEGVWRPRLPSVLAPAAAVRLPHRLLHLRGGEHRALAAGC